MSDTVTVVNIAANKVVLNISDRPVPASLAIYFLEGNRIMSDGIIRVDQKSITAHLAPLDTAGDVGASLPKDASGNAIVPAWTMGDTSVASIAVAADGLSATFTPKKAGDSSVDVVADLSAAQDGSNVQHGTGTLHVIAGAATSFSLSFDAAQN